MIFFINKKKLAGTLKNFCNDINTGKIMRVKSLIVFFSIVSLPGLCGVNNIVYYIPGSPATLISTNIYEPNNVNAMDGNVVVFGDAYNNAVDNGDAVHFNNPGVNFAILKGTNFLAIETRQPIGTNDTIFYRMWNMQQKTYRMEFVSENIAPGISAAVEDSYLGSSTPIDLNGTDSMNFTVNADPASASFTRFRLVFSPSVPLPVTFISLNVNKVLKGIDISWEVADEINIQQYEVQRSSDGRRFEKAGMVLANALNKYSWLDDNNSLTGTIFYRIKSISIAGEIKFTNIAIINIGNNVSDISVITNAGHIILKFVNEEKGVYDVYSTDVQGRRVFKYKIDYQGGNSLQVMSLPPTLQAGIYSLLITRAGKLKKIQQVLINSNK